MHGRSTAAILLMFLGSGCAALVYEVVWFHQLSLVLGATTISLAILLASFMGGLCLGSLALPRCVSPAHHPLRVYAVLELFIAAYGLLMLALLPAVEQLYVWWGRPGTNDLALRALLSAIVLLPPTMAMGATLPAIARWVSSSREGLSLLGWFYGANTLGAVAGSLFAGLYLLPQFDVMIATCAAAGVNVAVAALAWRISERMAYHPSKEVPASDRVVQPAWLVWVAIGLSGATALGAEAVWTRLLALLLGPTVYTFSIILAVFLLGLSFGTSLGTSLARHVRRPGLALAACQLSLMVCIPLSGVLMLQILPHWLIQSPSSYQPWVRIAVDVLGTFAVLLPCTLLWGASFPLAVAAADPDSSDNSRVVGRTYAANTVGAIAGALAIGLIALPLGGSQLAQQVLAAVAGIAGVVMLLASAQSPAFSSMPGFCVRFRSPASKAEAGLRPLGAFGDFANVDGTPHEWRPAWQAGLVAAMGMCAIAIVATPRVPPGLLAWGRMVSLWDTSREVHYLGEGLDASILVATSQKGIRCFHICGKVEASNSLDDQRTQRLLGHLPAMAHPQPKKALVIGCGSGMTAGALLLHPSIEEIVLCEMEPHVIRAAREWFATENHGVLDHPKTRIVIDDARHFIATTDETFDIITTDPIHPWVRGAASLYTAEFYERCRSRLNPGGVVAQWVPLYESNEPAVRCEVATIVHSFPGTSVWGTQGRAIGYDLVALGTKDGTPVDALQMQHSLRRNGALRQSLQQLGLESLPQMYVAGAADLSVWSRGAPLNRDGNLRLQYLAGRDHENQRALQILQAMIGGRGAFDTASRAFGN